jgi:hypothetical protein
MKPLIAALLVAHATAHLAGFAWPWWLLEPLPSPPNDTAWIGDTAMQTLSVFWLVVAIAFIVAALALLARARSWRYITEGAAIASLVLSVSCWPGSLLGVPVNLAILALLYQTRDPRPRRAVWR